MKRANGHRLLHQQPHRRAATGFLAIAIAAGANAAATHINGFAVSEATRSGQYNWKTFAPEGVFNGATIWGKLCKFTIRDGQSIKCDTIFGQLANYPVISPDGRRVAFYRLGATVDYAANKLVGSLQDSGWISVIDTNGQNLRNLVRMGHQICSNATDWEHANLSWPSGNWIYYPRPCNTGEIWRVNVNDPSKNQFVVKFQKADRSKCCNAGCIDARTNGLDAWSFRRFHLSKDATRAAGEYYGYTCGGTGIHCFPPVNRDWLASGCLMGTRGGCNACISPSGKYFAFYPGSHYQVCLSMVTSGNTLTDVIQPAVNRTPSMGDLAQWTGTKALPYGMMMRWASNSDKWILIAGCHYDCSTVSELGMDQVALNWVESSGIVLSRNVWRDMCFKSGAGDCMNWDCLVQQGPIPGNGAGDLYISGGPANAYEDAAGQWIPVPPLPDTPVNAMRAGMPSVLPMAPVVVDNAGILIVNRVAAGSRLEISDMQGKPVLTRRVGAGTSIVPAGSLIKGLYVVRIIAPDLSRMVCRVSVL